MVLLMFQVIVIGQLSDLMPIQTQAQMEQLVLLFMMHLSALILVIIVEEHNLHGCSMERYKVFLVYFSPSHLFDNVSFDLF